MYWYLGRKTKAPKIGDTDWDYTQHLRIGLLEGVEGDRVGVAIWVEADAQELKARDIAKTILHVTPADDAPPWVQVIGSWGWFPAFVLPLKIDPKMAKVLARSVRTNEAKALRERYDKKYALMYQQLVDAQAPLGKRKGTRAAKGMPVYVDLAWEILRSELGFGGGGQRKHWRPAIKNAMKHIPVAVEHFASYLMDGNEEWFDVHNDGVVGWTQVRSGIGFQQELMPFVKGFK